ncbi:hypothetical protein PX52LOC_03310 [Limnoglobus roseus]|uniref:Uncharacterized protein n=1 Tax=Limnoglobus roseus TaxID=2598579 RepID=A0A5C1AAW4_9BACT|nr:hypothetical protein PX52LOC_03310 [Limnoglobus roseus]
MFLRLLKARRAFDPARGVIEAYLAVVTPCTAADLLRRQLATRRTAVVHSLHGIGEDEPADPHDPIPRSMWPRSWPACPPTSAAPPNS